MAREAVAAAVQLQQLRLFSTCDGYLLRGLLDRPNGTSFFFFLLLLLLLLLNRWERTDYI